MSYRKWLSDFSRRRKNQSPPVDPFATKSARDLADVLVALDIIDPGRKIRIRRVYAGRHQRSAGAWSWYAENELGNEVCGSQFTVQEILQAAKQQDRCVSVSFANSSVSLFPENHLGDHCPNCRSED